MSGVTSRVGIYCHHRIVHTVVMNFALNWVGWTVGLVAAVITIAQTLRSRRRHRAEDRAYEILNRQLDAEDAEKKAKTAEEKVELYQQRRLDLRRQIEQEIPNEARKAYLKNRLDGLAKSIADDFREYTKIEQQLKDSKPALDPSIQSIIEQTLLPVRRSQRARERLVLGVVAFLALAILTPINQVSNAYSKVVSEPAHYGGGRLFLALLLAVIFWFLVARIAFSATSIGTSSEAGCIVIFATAIISVTLIAIGLYQWLHIHDNPPYNDATYSYDYAASFGYIYWLLTGATIAGGMLLAGISVSVGRHIPPSTTRRESRGIGSKEAHGE
jgi:hypothetical protein